MSKRIIQWADTDGLMERYAAVTDEYVFQGHPRGQSTGSVQLFVVAAQYARQAQCVAVDGLSCQSNCMTCPHAIVIIWVWLDAVPKGTHGAGSHAMHYIWKHIPWSPSTNLGKLAYRFAYGCSFPDLTYRVATCACFMGHARRPPFDLCRVQMCQ